MADRRDLTRASAAATAAVPKKLGRRSFVRNAALGGVVLIGWSSSAAGFVDFFWPNKTGAFGKTLTRPGER